MPGKEQITHPSFGTIGAFRISGKTKLFQSDVEHMHFIGITISRAKVERDLNQDWVHGGEEVIEVYMSELQFAQFITSMNMGSGIPCTLKYVNGEKMPETPYATMKETFTRELKEDVQKVSAHLSRAHEMIRELREGITKPTKKNLGALAEELARTSLSISSSLPFLESQFIERMEHTVTEAKAAIDAHVLNLVTNTGLKALGVAAPRMLNDGEETEPGKTDGRNDGEGHAEAGQEA